MTHILKLSNWKDFRLSLSRTLYLEKLLSTSHDITDEYLKRVRSLAENSCSFPHTLSETLHRVEYPGFRSSTLCNFELTLLAASLCTHGNSLTVCFTMFISSHNCILWFQGEWWTLISHKSLLLCRLSCLTLWLITTPVQILLKMNLFCQTYWRSSQSHYNLCNSSMQHWARSPNVLHWAVGEGVVLEPLL
jgi:hypothetical protein